MKNNIPTIGAEDLKLLEELCNATGVSGDEESVRKIVLHELAKNKLVGKVDALGSVIVRQNVGNEGKLKVMIDAHIDEVGFMIVSDDGDGLFGFELVGGIDVRSLPGKQVLVGKHNIAGIIGAKPIHLTTAEERNNKLSLESLKIDVGGSKGGKVAVGDRAVFATRFRADEKNIFSKAIDDRIGVAILLKLLQTDFDNIDLYASFSVQEEIGLRGAKVSARAISPDVAIAIDATPSYDHPTYDGTENVFYNTLIGKGPAIYTYDGGTLNDPRLIDFFLRLANENGIPAQLRQPGGGGTNAGSIHKSNGGIPTISISVPHRYTHTAMSISKITDWENSFKLIFAGLQNISLEILNKPRS